VALVMAALACVPMAAHAQSTPARAVANKRAADPDKTVRPVTSKASGVTIEREAFSYDAEGRRDPFVSLISSSELRPMASDLRLAVVVYDPDGDSRAVLRDIETNEQYKVRVGQQLGRMRVARIRPKSVTFTILEFGESRQETLALNDSTTARTP
jgi:hypothetical protein